MMPSRRAFDWVRARRPKRLQEAGPALIMDKSAGTMGTRDAKGARTTLR